MADKKPNPMHDVKIAKVTLNVGTGKAQGNLDKAMKLLESLTGVPPVKCITQKKIAAWGLRPGLPIGCKTTLRGEVINTLLPRLFYARDFKLPAKCFDDYGNVAFGIHEHIDIKDAQYDPKIGIMGLQITITLERPGYRVMRRKIRSRKISREHRVNKQDAVDFLKQKFNVELKVAE